MSSKSFVVAVNAEGEAAVLTLSDRHMAPARFILSGNHLIAVVAANCTVPVGDLEDPPLATLQDMSEILFATIAGDENEGHLVGESVVPIEVRF